MSALLDEITALANAMHVNLGKDLRLSVLNRIASFRDSKISTSMHDDFLANKSRTEISSLCGYLVRKGAEYDVKMPAYTKIFEALKKSIGVYPQALMA